MMTWLDLTGVGIAFIEGTKNGAKLAMLKGRVDKYEDGTQPTGDWGLYEIDRT